VSKLSKTTVGRAAAIAFPIIVVVICVLFGISFLLSNLLGLPYSLGLPLAVRAVGGVVVVAGLSVIGWVFSYRSPAKVIVSTYITFAKLFGRVPVAEKAGRTEPLVVGGPQKYVRSPLYFGVIVMVLGWAMLGAHSFVFVATVVLLIWFGLILVPFEERELQALFGEEWREYSEQTPMLIPFTKRRKKSAVAAA
jgi:protein-S-isoprenylcysteine O-methyltransferase Ste14